MKRASSSFTAQVLAGLEHEHTREVTLIVEQHPRGDWDVTVRLVAPRDGEVIATTSAASQFEAYRLAVEVLEALAGGPSAR